MNPQNPPSLRSENWRTLYRAAIFETNRRVIPNRVMEAEKAVLARGRELFRQIGTMDEKEALEDALYALRAYKTAWLHTESADAA